MTLEQKTIEPSMTWEELLDDMRGTLQNFIDEHQLTEERFRKHVADLEYEDLITIFDEPLQDYIDQWKDDSLVDLLWEINQGTYGTKLAKISHIQVAYTLYGTEEGFAKHQH
jgi:hypothetical protein